MAAAQLALEEEGESFLNVEPRPARSSQKAWVVLGGGIAVFTCGVAFTAWPKAVVPPSSISQEFVELAPSECNDAGEDCSKTKCCSKDGYQCFEKNEFWAVCNATCVPGVHPGEDDKGWTCNVLAPVGIHVESNDEAPHAPCVGDDADCSKSKCCTGEGSVCWEKNEWYASCMKTCEPGVHEGDPDGTPWTCMAMTPDMIDTTTMCPTQKPPPAPHVGGATPPVNCDAGPTPNIPQFSGYEGPKPMFIKVLSYNLFWWSLFAVRKGNGNSAGLLIQSANSPLPWDLMGFQECEDGPRVLAGASLLDDFEVYQFNPLTKTSAICMAFRKEAFALIAQGGEFVAEDGKMQYYGKRALQWQRLTHKPSGKVVFFANHHGPLAVGSGGKCGGAITGFHILRVIANNAKPGDAIILTGDFNAEPGSATLKVVSERLTDFVPAGIDNIFSNLHPGALVRNMDIGDGGSDHDARLAVFQLGKVVGGAPAKPGPETPVDV